MDNVDVVIVGSSIAAVMTAAYLKQQLPDLSVVVLGPSPENERRPYVGESLVEPAALFMREIGLGDYLDRTQMIKNGLSFYHKIKSGDPVDRRYSVHAPRRLYHTAWRLNRPEVGKQVASYSRPHEKQRSWSWFWLADGIIPGTGHDIPVAFPTSPYRTERP